MISILLILILLILLFGGLGIFVAKWFLILLLLVLLIGALLGYNRNYHRW